MDKKRECVICKNHIEGFGHNADPLANGVCCDKCNDDVIAERMRLLFNI